MDKLSHVLDGLEGKFQYVYFKDLQGHVIPETMHYLIDGGTEGFNG